ncbi:cysteine desulfurase [Fodinisporobacter ferrooxydans]|uniref:cysteine desulfurase n=1 Tax=Fodinisporobacter ferrooxydans TaxID=2901836 RepID=A0ABY4CK55_9BACL|nr:cysteine desulfurase [Alicyclobacillaceae bacterium MYW30-H2]
MQRIYLDYNASTPIAPEVAEAMKPFLTDYYGNPSTSHWAGKPARQAFEKARQQVANLLGCEPDEIIFTSGGSESNNHALKGVFFALKEKGSHIITTQIEHPAIINPCKFLEKLGAKVTYVGVDRYGQVSPTDIEQAITHETILISVMHANNEVGTIQPIADIAKIAKKYGVLLHTDAAQSVGKIPTRVDELGVDLLSVAGHKVYAPKGIGALYIKRGTQLEPFVHGAGHEGGRRAGTENILLAVGLGKACELAAEHLNDAKIKDLRDYFWDELKKHFKEDIVLNGHPEECIPNTVSVSFIGKVGQDILENIPELAASTGSACHSGMVQLSSVLRAMEVEEHVGKGTIRFSLGRYTTKEEIDQVVRRLKESV